MSLTAFSLKTSKTILTFKTVSVYRQKQKIWETLLLLLCHFFSLVSRCCQDSCSLTVSLLALSVILTPHPLFLSVLMFINNIPAQCMYVSERERESILCAVLTSALSLGVAEFLCQVESVSPAQSSLNSSAFSSKG